MNNIDLEVAMIKKFIVASKQERYIQFVSSAKNRKKFIRNLAHFSDFNEKDIVLIPSNYFTEAYVLGKLKQENIDTDTCYVISECTEMDTKTFDAETALSNTIGINLATIIIFGNANMIYYEDEGLKKRYLSDFKL